MDGQEQKQIREYDPVMGWGTATYEGSQRVSFEPEGKQLSPNADPDFYPAYADDGEEDQNRDNRNDYDGETEGDESEGDGEDGEGEGDDGSEEENPDEGGEGEEPQEEIDEDEMGNKKTQGEEGEKNNDTNSAADDAADKTKELIEEELKKKVEQQVEQEAVTSILANPWVDVIGLIILVVIVIVIIMVAGFSKSGGSNDAGVSGVPFDCTGKTYAFPYADKNVPTIPKTHHNYSAIDLMSKDGQSLVAVTNGTVSNPHFTDAGDGGIGFTLKGDDGFTYYYAHLEYLDPKMQSGYTLKAGDSVGRSGHTGNASASAPHLHFGISSTGHRVKGFYPYQLDYDLPSAQMSPWQTLEAWKNNQCITPGT